MLDNLVKQGCGCLVGFENCPIWSFGDFCRGCDPLSTVDDFSVTVGYSVDDFLYPPHDLRCALDDFCWSSSGFGFWGEWGVGLFK